MKNSIVVMNLSGIYEKESFYKNTNPKIINCKEILGTNCYCDDNGESELKSRIKDFTPEGIHFIDSGNYHYITKFWTDKIKKNFDLIVFDHHTDMKESMFWNLLSCGSWVKEVLDTNTYVKKVILIGPAGKYINQIEDKYRNKVIALNEEEIKNKDISQLAESLDIKEPIYISIDKDILDEKEIKTNWDQGSFSLKELEEIIKNIINSKDVIGIDICGECSENLSHINQGEVNERNNEVNKELMEFCLEECAKDIELVK